MTNILSEKDYQKFLLERLEQAQEKVRSCS